MTSNIIETKCKQIIGNVHTMQDCIEAFDDLKKLLTTKISENDFNVVESYSKMLIQIRDLIFNSGEEKYNYQVLCRYLNDELIPKNRLEYLLHMDLVFQAYFPKSMYGHIILDLIAEHKAKLN